MNANAVGRAMPLEYSSFPAWVKNYDGDKEHFEDLPISTDQTAEPNSHPTAKSQGSFLLQYGKRVLLTEK